MARATFGGEGKTQFVIDVLANNARANTTAVNLAWKSAGRDGTISAALVNKLRSAMGLTGNLRVRPKKHDARLALEKPPHTGKKRGRKPQNQPTARFALNPLFANGRMYERAAELIERRAPPSIHFQSFEELEADIDRLIFKVMELGGMSAVEETLRMARRLLYRGFAGRGL
jgi:hypothetical protein